MVLDLKPTRPKICSDPVVWCKVWPKVYACVISPPSLVETTINPALHSSLIQCSPSSSFIMRCAFTLLAALAAVILVQANPNIPGRSDDCPPNDIWRNGCDDFENICKISCAEGESCEYLGGSCGNHEDVEILDSLQCQKICEASRDNEEVSEVSRHCRFWRWVSKTWTLSIGQSQELCTTNFLHRRSKILVL